MADEQELSRATIRHLLAFCACRALRPSTTLCRWWGRWQAACLTWPSCEHAARSCTPAAPLQLLLQQLGAQRCAQVRMHWLDVETGAAPWSACPALPKRPSIPINRGTGTRWLPTRGSMRAWRRPLCCCLPHWTAAQAAASRWRARQPASVGRCVARFCCWEPSLWLNRPRHGGNAAISTRGHSCIVTGAAATTNSCYLPSPAQWFDDAAPAVAHACNAAVSLLEAKGLKVVEIQVGSGGGRRKRMPQHVPPARAALWP